MRHLRNIAAGLVIATFWAAGTAATGATEHAAADSATITITVKNGSTKKKWAVTDTNDGGKTLLDRELAADETVTLVIKTSSGGKYGEIKYKHDGQSVWTNKSLISNGDSVDLY